LLALLEDARENPDWRVLRPKVEDATTAELTAFFLTKMVEDGQVPQLPNGGRELVNYMHKAREDAEKKALARGVLPEDLYEVVSDECWPSKTGSTPLKSLQYEGIVFDGGMRMCKLIKAYFWMNNQHLIPAEADDPRNDFLFRYFSNTGYETSHLHSTDLCGGSKFVCLNVRHFVVEARKANAARAECQTGSKACRCFPPCFGPNVNPPNNGPLENFFG
jgi:hypothetical protein